MVRCNLQVTLCWTQPVLQWLILSDATQPTLTKNDGADIFVRKSRRCQQLRNLPLLCSILGENDYLILFHAKFPHQQRKYLNLKAYPQAAEIEEQTASGIQFKP